MHALKRKRMGYLASVLAVLFLGRWATASAQTLAEIAEKEKARRQELEEQRSELETPARTPATEAPSEETKPAPAPLAAEATQEVPSDVVSPSQEFFLHGSYYADWFRTTYGNGVSSSQLSNRLKLELGRPAGDGWRGLLDVRDRLDNGGRLSNLLIVYDARLTYEDRSNPFTLTLGQMGLYDTVGVGQLLGGVLGYRIRPALTIGGYAGLEPEIYGPGVDPGYQKYGVYAQFYGSGAKSASVSYNALRFDGESERQFLHSSVLLPFTENGMFYGNLEYELSSSIAGQDRLSLLFLNARYDFTRSVDVTANYSTGKGLDYHRFLLEQSQDPGRNDAEIERFYYSTQFGARLSVQPIEQFRVFIAQGESEQKDLGIRNHSTTIGASAWNFADLGLSVYGNYRINRGDASESDSYRISVSRDFGLVSWTVYYSSVFHAVRFDPVTGLPLLIRIPDRRTLSNDVFFAISPAAAISLEYEHSTQGGPSENALFFRFIYRL